MSSIISDTIINSHFPRPVKYCLKYNNYYKCINKKCLIIDKTITHTYIDLTPSYGKLILRNRKPSLDN